MLSLIETVEKLRRGEAVSEQELRAHQNSSNAVERFFAHNALSTIALQGARDHLIDALRAIDYADRQVLQTYIDLSKLTHQLDGVAQAVVKYALAMIDRKQWVPAFEAISQAIRFDQANNGELTHDQIAWTQIALAYEQATRTLGRVVNRPAPSGGPVRVAILTSELCEGTPTQQLIAGWARHANPDIASLRVYCTQSASKPIRHELNLIAPSAPTGTGESRVVAELKARRMEVWFAPPDADAIQVSRILTERIARDQIELLLVDSTLADASIAMAVATRPAVTQVAIARGFPVPLSGIDQVVQTGTPQSGEADPFWKSRNIRTRAIFQGIETDPQTAGSRRDYGVSDEAIVLMTCSEDPARMSMPFVRMVARLLAEHPRAVYLHSGQGDVSSAKRAFETAGVSSRVGFAGPLRVGQSFVSMADVYLAEFPQSSRAGVLEAMSAGKPVMILASEADPAGSARFVAAPYAVVGSEATLLDRCAAMLRDTQLRTSVGASLKKRVAESFGMCHTIDGLMKLASEVSAQRIRSVPSSAAPTFGTEKWPSENRTAESRTPENRLAEKPAAEKLAA